MTFSSAIGEFNIGNSSIGGTPSSIPPFPPAGPTTLTQTIPSYLYQEYNDDEDLQAFVDAYNDMAQTYVTWFATVQLPVYTGQPIAGPLLDWVAAGLYGMYRPNITSGISSYEGPLNTFVFNVLEFNQQLTVIPPTSQPATDDVFKRIMTWVLYLGDGKQFNVRWLKRRIARFLNGYDGTDVGTDDTDRISVTFGLNNQVNITIESGRNTIQSSSVMNGFALNTTPFNDIVTTHTPYPPLPMADTFKEAMDANLLPVPFQFSYIVTV